MAYATRGCGGCGCDAVPAEFGAKCEQHLQVLSRLTEVTEDMRRHEDVEYCAPVLPSCPPKSWAENVPIHARKWDLFLSHLQRNAQDAVISMRLFLKQAHPTLRCFVDMEVDMEGDLEQTLRQGVASSKAFLFFITDGALSSVWCQKEVRWAVEMQKPIILVRETDARHGGLEMNTFLEQVPQDLVHLFRNSMAIPWHREPLYRDVSIQAILKAAGLVSTYSEDLAELDRAKRKLQTIFVARNHQVTAIDVIQENSTPMRIVFFLGGFSRFKTAWVDHLYVLVFNVSFLVCGILCTSNLVCQMVPYHVLSTDALTAYVHLPAWQSWRRWRIFVASQACEELLAAAMEVPSNRMWIEKSCYYSGILVMMLQALMVAVVLCGFSLPYDIPGEGMEHHNEVHVCLTQFAAVHSHAMWAIIPPVIAAMFCSYSMFAFVALLHLLDIHALKTNIRECANVVARFQLKQCPSAAVSLQVKEDVKQINGITGEVELTLSGSRDAEDVRDLQANFQQLQLESHLFTVIMELLGIAMSRTQRYMDNTCKQVGWLWIHLVFFSMCQLLAIVSAGHAHIVGFLKGLKYRWWWALQDTFHLGGGLVLLCAAMGVFCVVTTVIQRVPRFALERLQAAGCPSERVGAIAGMLKAGSLGMHILEGTVCIDIPKAVGFFLILLVAMLQALIEASGSLSVNA